MTLLYHGTNTKSAENIRKRGVLLERCNEFTDFGRGFYTSKFKEFAMDTALNKSLKSKIRGIDIVPAVVIFEFDDVAFDKLKCYSFHENDVEWLQFIINNRNGWNYVNTIADNFHNLDGAFHIVEGGIADGDVVGYAETCRIQKKKVSNLNLQSFQYKDNFTAHQTSFHTNEALKYLHLVDYEEVTI